MCLSISQWNRQSKNAKFMEPLSIKKINTIWGEDPRSPQHIFFTNHLRKPQPQQNVCRTQTNSDYDLIQTNPNRYYRISELDKKVGEEN